MNHDPDEHQGHSSGKCNHLTVNRTEGTEQHDWCEREDWQTNPPRSCRRIPGDLLDGKRLRPERDIGRAVCSAVAERGLARISRFVLVSDFVFRILNIYLSAKAYNRLGVRTYR
jgi:hypothetical protein